MYKIYLYNPNHQLEYKNGASIINSYIFENDNDDNKLVMDCIKSAKGFISLLLLINYTKKS
jgi:hypothetical protein